MSRSHRIASGAPFPPFTFLRSRAHYCSPLFSLGSDKEEEALSPPPTLTAAASESDGRESDGDGQGQGPESTSALGQTWGPSLAFGQVGVATALERFGHPPAVVRAFTAVVCLLVVMFSLLC